MMLGNPLLLTSDDAGYQVSRSLRFRASASARLTRTPASAGNRKTMTFSLWVKRGQLGVASYTIFGIGTTVFIRFSDDAGGDTIRIYGGAGVLDLITAVQFRDPSAWAHLVVAIDTTQATASNRVKIYWNNQQITNLAAPTYPTLNLDTGFNTASASVIGALNTAEYFDGYMTEFYFIDGQALTPSSFAETDLATGVWKPKKYAGTYGTNGYYLNFSDNSAATAAAIGKDYSGNGNNWTPNNISVTAGATYDSMTDVPTLTSATQANFCTLNPLIVTATNGTASNGNLSGSTVNTGGGDLFGTMAFPSSGKFYFETTFLTNLASCNAFVGVATPIVGTQYAYQSSDVVGYNNITGDKWVNGVQSSYGATYTNNDIIGVAVDVDSSQVTFYKNNVSQGAISFSSGGKFPYVGDGNSNTFFTYAINFGQRPFAYTPPTGFKALNTQNLPEPTIKKGNQYFDVGLYTGDGVNGKSVVTGLSFTPDLAWGKTRSTTGDHAVVDAVRGNYQTIFTNLTQAETSQNTYALNVANSLYAANAMNVNGTTYSAWMWKEGATQGFDIVTYTGNGANRTVAHSLGVAPRMVIVKKRTGTTGSGSSDWIIWHGAIAASSILYLNSTAAVSTNASAFNSTAPTSSVFSLGTNTLTNENTGTFVAYLFAEVAGFSKFGSYTGNGSADGPFVFCGFRPRWVMIKRTDATASWVIMDTARDTFNIMQNNLLPNTSDADAPFAWLDMTSNGFKVRTNNAAYNASGGTYIFAAFAENPFKYSLAR